jgi:hypothetical protein
MIEISIKDGLHAKCGVLWNRYYFPQWQDLLALWSVFSMPKGIDSDYAWLKTHLNFSGEIQTRTKLVKKVANNLNERIEDGRLPYTLGVFGGWGTGKTTFLAMLAETLEKKTKCKIVYFNSWKYAGFMEIVPSLIYKILQYGLDASAEKRDEDARRILLALGNKYSDQIGQWAQKKIGVDPVELFKDIYKVSDTGVMPDVIHAYYTQIDKAQDELREALGTVTPGKASRNPIVVLIDELDRCDPDEAFNVIKQMRVLFGMRDLPVAFVICANPDPIGQAIKHRYGLESDTGDYEARRILEKFVDSYEDLSESVALRPLIQALWKQKDVPWIVASDEASERPRLAEDEVGNAAAFDAMTTSISLLSNIRVLHKSFEYIAGNTVSNRHLLWTKWFLEIASQIDPHFRRDLRYLAEPIQRIAFAAYACLKDVPYNGTQGAAIEYDTDKGKTLFAIFRSYFWERAREEHRVFSISRMPEDIQRANVLGSLLNQPAKMDVVALLCLLPFEDTASMQELCSTAKSGRLPKFERELEGLTTQLGFELAS